MRATIVALAVLGYGALAAALGVSLAAGDSSEVGWILVGPLPFCVVGAIGFLRRPENRVVWWLVGVGAAFGAQVALGDVFLPMAERHWGTGSSMTATLALLCQWAGTSNSVAVIGMIGLFPSGRPQRGYERAVIWASAVVAVLVPLLDAASAANIALTGLPDQGVPAVRSGVSLAALAPLRGTFVAVYNTYPFWTLIGIVLLALRYWQGKAAERRQIRWLLIGVTGSFSVLIPVLLLWWQADPDNAAASVLVTVLSALAIGTALVAMLTALFYSGVFGIDEPGRRAFVHHVLRISIAIAVAVVAVTAGLLTHLAAQAAVGVHNLHLAAELSRRVEEVRDQAAELAASRDRVVAGQDAERRRIQAVLHDGVQQEIVALAAKAGLVRQQLLRGDLAAADGLAEMQRDLATALRDVREIAYAIHPPVLSDRGLLEAIEAQSSRLALPMAVRAEPGLRGVRFGAQIEATAWYVLAEALSNVVKHAGASEVEVSLERLDGTLGLVIRDDGCGFDLDRSRGLGLTGLSDRLDTVGDWLTINSSPGLGTSVCVHIPVGRDQHSGPERAAGRERADA